MIFGPSGSLTLACADTLFLPVSSTSVYEGTVTLTLKRNVERLADMHVTLVGKARLEATSETFDTFRKTLTLSSEGEKLEAGTHVFAFAFEVPGSTAPSASCSHGSVRYTVEAIATGLARLGFDLMASKEVQLVSLAQSQAEMPEALDLEITDALEGVGSLKLNVWTPLAAVGSFLSGDLHWNTTDRAPGVRTLESGVNIRQTIEITSPSGQVLCPPPVTVPVYTFNKANPPRSFSTKDTGHPLCPPSDVELRIEDLPGGMQSYNFFIKSINVPTSVEILRLRWHQELQPTTLPGVDTPLRVSHELVYHVSWAQEGSTTGKRALFSKPITLASCACMLDELTLPMYSTAIDTTSRKKKRKGVKCLCALSLEELVEEQRAWIDVHAQKMTSFYAGDSPHPSEGVARVSLPPKVDDDALSRSSSTAT